MEFFFCGHIYRIDATDSNYTFLPWIIPSNIEIIASTKRIWIKPPIAYPKKPISQPIIRMTAMIYNKLLMIICLRLLNGVHIN